MPHRRGVCLEIVCRVCLTHGRHDQFVPLNLRAVGLGNDATAAIYQRKITWWVRFYHPLTRELVRESLGTLDATKAERLRERIDLETALLEPRFQAADIPAAIQTALGVPVRASVQDRDVSIAAPPPAVLRSPLRQKSHGSHSTAPCGRTWRTSVPKTPRCTWRTRSPSSAGSWARSGWRPCSD